MSLATTALSICRYTPPATGGDEQSALTTAVETEPPPGATVVPRTIRRHVFREACLP